MLDMKWIQAHFNSYSYALAETDGPKDKGMKKSTGSQIGGYAADMQRMLSDAEAMRDHEINKRMKSKTPALSTCLTSVPFRHRYH